MDPTPPSDPWSTGWKPDLSGARLAGIRTAQRGALLAFVAYGLVATAIVVGSGDDRMLLVVGLLVGAPAVMLLGAGLANAALGGRLDAIAVAVAFAVGMPVASVTSLVIGGWVFDGFAAGTIDIAGGVLRRSVSEALAVAPVVALTSAVWVLAVRRWAVTPARPHPPAAVDGSGE
jgi:hypothetical protein